MGRCGLQSPTGCWESPFVALQKKAGKRRAPFEWMIQTGGLDVVVDGVRTDNIRFSPEIRRVAC
jgi:hypothetical protein